MPGAATIATAQRVSGGGRGMGHLLAAVQALCETYGVPCQLSLEERMGCGIGACLGCNVKIMQPDGGWHYARVCKDGPVFDAKEVCLRG